MKLESNFCALPTLPISTAVASTSAWENFSHQPASVKPQFQSSTWVRLVNPPTAFSFDEAWLLCEAGENQWLAWIPDYGEILLNTEEFYAT